MRSMGLKIRIGFLVGIFLFGCSNEDQEASLTLENIVGNSEFVLGNVIACAATHQEKESINVFFYPRDGVTDIQYFETENALVDNTDFSNYLLVNSPLLPVFNGYLNKFEVPWYPTEKWAIVTFRENNQVHISNPIRLKQQTKPTEYLSGNLAIDASSNMPKFSWMDGSYDDSIIYFQVMSDDATNNLLSGTYTTERQFQYYKLDNVVLNITMGTPPVLSQNISYRLTLMAVSEDNWVNLIAERAFGVE